MLVGLGGLLLNKIDWDILNCLTDDFESMKQIYPVIKKEDNISFEETINRLITLYEDGFVCLEDNDILNIEELRVDVEKCEDDFSRFWFGLTSEGVKLWEDNALKFSGSEIEWKNAWSASLDYKNGVGFMCGKTREICELFLKDHFNKEKEIILDESSLEYTTIEKFKVKYYKTINDGVKLSFRFKKIN